MKNPILDDSRTFARLKEKSFEHFKDLYKVKILTNFAVSLTSSPGGAKNLAFNTLLITPPRNEVGFTSTVIVSFSS